jgi:hypothetical protein
VDHPLSSYLWGHFTICVVTTCGEKCLQKYFEKQYFSLYDNQVCNLLWMNKDLVDVSLTGKKQHVLA